jgi:hypothetical protein
MPAPSVPPPIAELGARSFSFHPAILNISHNQWVYQSATWSEVLARNTRTNETISIPRRYVGEVSRFDAPVMVVGLLTVLEYRAGAVGPAKRRVIEMPLAANDSFRARPRESPPTLAPVVGIRLEDGAETRIPKQVLAGVALGVVGCVLAISLYRGGLIASRAFYAPAIQQDLGLNSSDGYASVVGTLGPPAHERLESDAQDRQFHVLWYPRFRSYVVLIGRDLSDAHYIGTLDRNWRPVHTVVLPGQGNSYSLLAALRRF